jgi:hypothetical protein
MKDTPLILFQFVPSFAGTQAAVWSFGIAAADEL